MKYESLTTEFTNLPEGEVLNRYMDTMYRCISKLCPLLEPFEIVEGLNYSINKRFKTRNVKIHNSHLNNKKEIDILNLANQLLNDKAILTTQGVLFSKHGAVKNPFYNLIQYLLDKRDEAKKKMKTFPKGSEEFNKYNLLQLNYKVACNALYGCAGQWSSVYYNLYLSTAVTGQGRGCISASITMFEGFLANNIKFASLNEVLTFIDNICTDISTKPQKFNDWDILDRNIGVEECFLKIMENCGFNSWVPSDKAVQYIWDTINNLNQRELNIVYYKNNLYAFCNNSKISNLILKILCTLQTPFMNPNEPPEDIKQDIELLRDLMYEYVYYRHIFIDKLERVYTMVRDVVLLTDTDSCVVSLDQWYKYVLEKTIGIPMTIKYTKAQIKEAAENIVLEYQKTESVNEYDFYNDRLVATKRKTYPAVVIEEDSLRYSIINIIAYIVSDLIMDYMRLFSENYNTKGDRECLLIMKNEFLFKSMLLTDKKKNYASLQLLQEGNVIPYNKQFDIKGMPIRKVGMPKTTQDKLSDFIEYDILRSSIVDQVDLIKKFASFEKEIYNSIKAKNKEYHKPSRIKSISNYEKPMQIQGIKGAVAYNAIKSRDEEGLNLEERNTVLVIKTKINNKNCDLIAEEFPDHFLRMKKLLNTPEFGGKLESISIPTNINIPDWIIPFIDYTTIIQDNLRAFPFEELGISKMNSKDVTFSNIVKL